ncbi:MAG TPA: NYN domain-containing protein [Acidimicrobiales bacterium]|nr:NYN domain-containing protein [Acidimicrobiales bacterium]
MAAPPALRRYLNFARLPDPALDVARRVLDDDVEFRSRVAAEVDEDAVGRGGWLFLQRPEGWLAELDALLQRAAAAEIASKVERHERDAQRRLAGAEAALVRAETTARAKTDEAASVRLELETERRSREALEARLTDLNAEVEALRDERTQLIRRLKAAEATGAERSQQLRSTRHELRMVQAELTQVLPDAPALADRADGEASDESVTLTPVEPSGLDPALLGGLVADATTTLERLTSTLGALAELTGEPRAAEAPELGAEPDAGHEPTPAPSPPEARRRPVALPGGIFDDSLEAAEALIRTPGVLVLVDGYNIAHAQWHGLEPLALRQRLLDACGELHARARVDIEVVFDGAGDEAGSGNLARASVRYRFTPAGVEADDVILERIDQEPVDRPVLVVSSDRRVRDGADERGANRLGARQFLHLLRR